jgi:hypothetical protein
VGPFPFLIPLLKVLSPQKIRNWIKADDEIAKVSDDILGWYQVLICVQYAIRARDGWARAEESDRPRVDILARLEEAGLKNPSEALTAEEIIAEMMEIL